MTPLHLVGNWLREMLALVPLPVARMLFVALPLVLLVWILRLPREVTADPSSTGWARDLKVWASAALVIQIVIYALV